jgi:cytochrome oxidase Cu insertion factor (SCO1/SenC/PrrC family)
MCRLLRRTRRALVLGLALLAIGVGEAHEPQSGVAAAKVDVESVGPKVATSLPDFTLRDQRGEPHSLKSLLGPKGAIIVFFRSADW